MQINLMSYSPPSNAQQQKAYSQFAGLLSALTYGRWLVQYGLWLPVATIAAARLCGDYLGQYIPLPHQVWIVLAFVVCAGLHWLLSQSYKTHWFHKWDSDPFTRDGLMLPIVLAACLWFLDYKALEHQFTVAIPEPELLDENSAGEKKQAKLDGARSEYERLKAETQANLDAQLALAEPGIQREIAKWEAVKPRTWEDRQWKNKQLAQLHERFEKSPKVAKARAEAAARLDELLVAHNEDLADINELYHFDLTMVRDTNQERLDQHRSTTGNASTYAGVISLFCAVVFFYCAKRQVRIMTWCGMFPHRHYTQLAGHGNAVEKTVAVLSDVASRLFHRFIAWIHRIGSGGAIEDLDPRLNIRQGQYQDDRHYPTPDHDKQFEALRQELELLKQSRPTGLNGNHHPAPPNGLGKTRPR